jgi:hypothetical protein
MSFSRPIQWYHYHADLIWPDGPLRYRFSRRHPPFLSKVPFLFPQKEYGLPSFKYTFSSPPFERTRSPSCSSRKNTPSVPLKRARHTSCPSRKFNHIPSHSSTRSFVSSRSTRASPFLFLQKEHASFSFPRKTSPTSSPFR